MDYQEEDHLVDTLAAIDRWLVDRDMMSVICDGFKKFAIEQPLRLFTEKVIRCGNQQIINESALTTGAACFYCGLALRLINDQDNLTNIQDQLDALFSFTMLYMLADHYLDDSSIDQTAKDQLIQQVESCMLTNKFDDNPLSYHYHRIIELVPSAEPYLKTAIKSELMSCEIQKQSDLTFEDYRMMAYDKGGTSVQILQAIMGISPNRDGYQLGACIQVIDDIIDVEDDLAEGIHTMMTEPDALDDQFITAVHMVDKLPDIYNLFKPALMLMLLYGLTDEQHYTGSFLEKMSDYAIERKIEVRRIFYHVILSHLSKD